MTIDKAIEVLQNRLIGPANMIMSDNYQAYALGLEALKRLKEVRQSGLPYLRLPLPGETAGEEHAQ